jgi:hypothetical protein
MQQQWLIPVITNIHRLEAAEQMIGFQDYWNFPYLIVENTVQNPENGTPKRS